VYASTHPCLGVLALESAHPSKPEK